MKRTATTTDDLAHFTTKKSPTAGERSPFIRPGLSRAQKDTLNEALHWHSYCLLGACDSCHARSRFSALLPGWDEGRPIEPRDKNHCPKCSGNLDEQIIRHLRFCRIGETDD